MSILAAVLALGVVALVFGLAAMTWFALVGGLLYSGVRKAADMAAGWRDVTCPASKHPVEVRVGHVPGRELAVLNCSRFGNRPPTCGQMCLVDVPHAA